MKKRLLCALLALILSVLALPVDALAASKSISFGATSCVAYVGASGRLKPAVTGLRRSRLEWRSSKKSVVSVGAGGRVKAKKVGVATVTARCGKTKAKLRVTVLPRTLTLSVGLATALPRGGEETYRIDPEADANVAEVSATGVVTGKSPGETRVQVCCGAQVLNIAVKVGASGQSKAARVDCADTATQVVLVEHTGGSKATLSLHEKKDGLWTELYSCAAYVGRNGIGKTVEGDKKTPVGTYNLTTPFGIKDDPGAQMPYTKVTKYHYWCGASSSKYYNQLVDEREVSRKHTSSDEYLISYTGVYNYCMFIDYNAAGVAHKGSCIFLHCTGKNSYTAGCVAVPEEVMKRIIKWARPGVKIVIGEKLA